MEVEEKKSNRKGKRLMVEVDGKTVHFGDINAKGKTFYDTGDSDKKRAYVARHKVREDWNDPKSAGFWAKHVLWGERSDSGISNDIKSASRQKIKKVKLNF